MRATDDKSPPSGKDTDNIIQFSDKAKTTFVKTDKAYVKAEKVTVSTPKQPPKRTDVKNPLTKEHRKEIRDLITEWVTTSNLAKKPIDHKKAYSLLYNDGLENEVNGIEQIEESEFEQCKHYIKQRIMTLESVGAGRVMRRKSDWQTKRIKAIHARCGELGISEEQRKAYQLARFGKNSLVDFTDDELSEFYSYVMNGNPKFIMPKEQAKSIQQDRENALRVLLGFLEAKAKAQRQAFNPQRLNLTKPDIHKLLEQQNPDLFCNMSEEQFSKFWSKQQVCKLKPGRQLGTGLQ